MKFKAKKSFGQHFLKNNKIVKKIISLKNLKGKDIVEIGPGFGILTKEILKKKPKNFLCIEKDKSLKSHLKKIKYDKSVNFQILFKDALNFDLDKLELKKIILIANLPYYIASTLIIKWLQYIKIFDSIIVMVQSEVAKRLSAKVSSKFYGRLSVLIQLHTTIENKLIVGPENFFPKPKIFSSVIEIIPKKKINIDYENIDLLLKHSFKHRRKKITNNLQEIYPNIREKLIENGLSEHIRAQDIRPESYINLYKSLQ